MIAPAAQVCARSGLDRSLIEVEGVTFLPMPRLLALVTRSRSAAMTLGAIVFVRADMFDAVIAGEHAELVAHELIHVRQWRSDGVARFLGRYVGDYLRLRFVGLGHDDAYRRIGYEWEAYAEAHHMVQAT